MTDLRKQRAERFRNTDLYLVIGHEFTNGRSVLDVLAAAAHQRAEACCVL